MNSPDLLKRLREVSAVVNDQQQRGSTACLDEPSPVRSRWLRDRFTVDERQRMIDMFTSGMTQQAVADEFGVSLSAVKRLLRKHGVRRRTG